MGKDKQSQYLSSIWKSRYRLKNTLDSAEFGKYSNKILRRSNHKNVNKNSTGMV